MQSTAILAQKQEQFNPKLEQKKNTLAKDHAIDQNHSLNDMFESLNDISNKFNTLVKTMNQNNQLYPTVVQINIAGSIIDTLYGAFSELQTAYEFNRKLNALILEVQEYIDNRITETPINEKPSYLNFGGSLCGIIKVYSKEDKANASGQLLKVLKGEADRKTLPKYEGALNQEREKGKGLKTLYNKYLALRKKYPLEMSQLPQKYSQNSSNVLPTIPTMKR